MSSASAHFGEFGGQYVPETLMAALEELEEAYGRVRSDAAFRASFSVCSGSMWEGRRLFTRRGVGVRPRGAAACS